MKQNFALIKQSNVFKNLTQVMSMKHNVFLYRQYVEGLPN